MTESCSGSDGKSTGTGNERREKRHDGFGRFGSAPWAPKASDRQPREPMTSRGICEHD